jgi:two-component system chemotaxis sensor kinase CheA
MDRDLFRQIWPVFSAEAREHLEGLSAGILELERDPTRIPVLDGVRRIAHSLKGSAGSLGLGDLERIAHAIEGSLAGLDPAIGLSRAAVQATLEAVDAVEEAIAAGDAGGVIAVPGLEGLLAGLGAAAPDGSAARRERGAPLGDGRAEAASASVGGDVGFREDALVDMDALEGALEQLCAPLDGETRRAVATGAARVAVQLAAPSAPGAAALARRAADAFTVLAEGGADAPRATAALAGDLIDLREALARASASVQEAAAGAPAAQIRGERSIRVLTSRSTPSAAGRAPLTCRGPPRRRARDVLAHSGSVRDAPRRSRTRAGAARRRVEAGRAEVEVAASRLREIASDPAGWRARRTASRSSSASRAPCSEDLRALRMVPAALVLEPRRAARDVAGRLGKEVELTVEGGDVRVDRQIVDALRIRSCTSYGTRWTTDRGARRAPRRRQADGGRIAARFEPRGTRVAIVVEDDGPGLDVAAIRAAAVRKGALTAEQVDRLTDREAARLVFQAGLSTASAVTEISGRGVGMDVVLETVARLQGTVDVRWEPGRGTLRSRGAAHPPASAALLLRLGATSSRSRRKRSSTSSCSATRISAPSQGGRPRGCPASTCRTRRSRSSCA